MASKCGDTQQRSTPCRKLSSQSQELLTNPLVAVTLLKPKQRVWKHTRRVGLQETVPKSHSQAAKTLLAAFWKSKRVVEFSSAKHLASLDAPLGDGLTNRLDVPSNRCIRAMAQPVVNLMLQKEVL